VEREAIITLPDGWPDFRMSSDDKKRELIGMLVDQGKVSDQHPKIVIRRIQTIRVIYTFFEETPAQDHSKKATGQ
jgi:hypothetical protein